MDSCCTKQRSLAPGKQHKRGLIFPTLQNKLMTCNICQAAQQYGQLLQKWESLAPRKQHKRGLIFPTLQYNLMTFKICKIVYSTIWIASAQNGYLQHQGTSMRSSYSQNILQLINDSKFTSYQNVCCSCTNKKLPPWVGLSFHSAAELHITQNVDSFCTKQNL